MYFFCKMLYLQKKKNILIKFLNVFWNKFSKKLKLFSDERHFILIKEKNF